MDSPITVEMQNSMSTQTPKDPHTWLHPDGTYETCNFGICEGNGYFQDVDEGQDIGCLCSYRTLKNATYLDYPAEKYDISDEQVDKWNRTLRAHGIQCLQCDYVPQPREMNERTTYECSYCGSISGCP